MRILIYILAALIVAVIAAAVYVRVAPVAVDDWHVDPEATSPPQTPNFVLFAGSQAVPVDAPTLAVAGRVQAVAEAEGAQVLAGSAAEGFVTYVVRSRIMGYPDFVTIRLEPGEDGGTQVNIFSRSRYGRSDLGVNAARVQRWLTAARDETDDT